MFAKVISLLAISMIISGKPALIGQVSLQNTWTLPQGMSIKDEGQRTYRFTVEYSVANSKGDVTQRQRLVGEYTRGLPGGEVSWKNVTQSDAVGSTSPFEKSQKRDFMEGFHYRNDPSLILSSGFFKTFPSTAIYERNLVWDTGMIESFGQNFFEYLKLNEPFVPIAGQNLQIPDLGIFRNHRVQLQWIGRSQRNGQECAVIQYQAFFNSLDFDKSGMTMKGRSDYWGEIWVSLTTKQIEYGTIYESVMGEMKLPGQEKVEPVHVFRTGVFEPINMKQPN